MSKKGNTTHIAGIGFLLITAILYASVSFFSRITGTTIPIFFQNMVRNSFTALLLLPFILSKPFPRVHRADWVWILIRTLSGIAAFVAYYLTILVLPLGISYCLFYGVSAIAGYILGIFLCGETLTRKKILALLLALIGLTLVYSFNIAALPLPYVVLGALSGVTTALWNILPKKISNTYSATVLSFLDTVLTIPFSLLLSLIGKEAWVIPAATPQWGAMFFVGFLFSITGILMVEGFKRVEAQVGSLIMLSEILFSILLGFLLYQEKITLSTFLGALLIIAAMAIPELASKAVRAHRRLRQKSSR